MALQTIWLYKTIFYGKQVILHYFKKREAIEEYDMGLLILINQTH